MTRMVLIRHARSVANAEGILAGRVDGVELDDVGRGQATALGELLDGVGFGAVYRSPILRCARTAELAGWADAVVDERLTECDYGDWTGRSLRDLVDEPLWGQIQREPSAVAFPGGESMLGMRDRVVDAARDIAARHSDRDVVALVSHGDPIKAMLSHALGQSFDDFQRIVAAPASVSVIDLPASGRPSVWCINAGSDVTAMLRGASQATVGGGDSPPSAQ